MVFNKTAAATVADYIILVNVLNSKTTTRTDFIFTSEYTAGFFTDPKVYAEAKNRIIDHWSKIFKTSDPTKQSEIDSDINYVHAHLYNQKSDLSTHCHWNIRSAEDELCTFLSDCFSHRSKEEQGSLPIKRNEMDCHVDRLPEMFKSGYQALTSEPPFQRILQLRPHLTFAYKDSHLDNVDTPEQATMLLTHYLEKIEIELEKAEPSYDFFYVNLLDRAEPLARQADNIASIDKVAELLATAPEKIVPDNPKDQFWSDCSLMLYLLIEDYKPLPGTEELLKILNRYNKYLASRQKLLKARRKTQKLLTEAETIEARLESVKTENDEGLLAFTYCKLGNLYYQIAEHSQEKTKWLKRSKQAFKEALAITKYGSGPAAWAWPMMFLLKLRAQYALRPPYWKKQFFGPLDTVRLRKAQKLLMQGSTNMGPDNSLKMITTQKVLEGRSGWHFAPMPNSDGGQTLEELGL